MIFFLRPVRRYKVRIGQPTTVGTVMACVASAVSSGQVSQAVGRAPQVQGSAVAEARIAVEQVERGQRGLVLQATGRRHVFLSQSRAVLAALPEPASQASAIASAQALPKITRRPSTQGQAVASAKATIQITKRQSTRAESVASGQVSQLVSRAPLVKAEVVASASVVLFVATGQQQDFISARRYRVFLAGPKTAYGIFSRDIAAKGSAVASATLTLARTATIDTKASALGEARMDVDTGVQVPGGVGFSYIIRPVDDQRVFFAGPRGSAAETFIDTKGQAIASAQVGLKISRDLSTQGEAIGSAECNMAVGVYPTSLAEAVASASVDLGTAITPDVKGAALASSRCAIRISRRISTLAEAVAEGAISNLRATRRISTRASAVASARVDMNPEVVYYFDDAILSLMVELDDAVLVMMGDLG